MKDNPTAVALAVMTLGIISIPDIIPGAGFHAGAIIVALGGAIHLGQFVMRDGPFLSAAGWTRLPALPVASTANRAILSEAGRRSS